MSPTKSPVVRFHSMIANARPPQRADRSAAGTLPTRAFRYCEAVTSASAFGWWVFPPLDFQVIWDGADIFWAHDAEPQWQVLASSALAPDFAAAFDAAAPPALAGRAPPFLTALPEIGTLQIWTGLMARTRPDWSLLLRAPANVPPPGGYTLYEGIVESDRWFGPLFTNVRLTRSHTPIRFRSDFPLLQVQPLPRDLYSDGTLAAMAIGPDMPGFAPDDWDAFDTSVVAPSADTNRPFGAYATATRKRARSGCPMHATA